MMPYQLDTRDGYIRRIIATGRAMNITARGIVIAISTGLVESNIKVCANKKLPESFTLPHDAIGDDGYSVGIFQQQVRTGNGGAWWWGDCEACMNPETSARMFFERLAKRNYNTGDAGAHAQAVQQSAFPTRYAERMGEAQQLYDRLAPQVGGNYSETPNSSEGGTMPDYGITKTMHGYRADTPANATGNSNGPRGRTDFIVIHTQEGDGTAVSLSNYLNSHDVSYNLVVDDTDTVEVVPVNEGPWAAADANNIGVHICFAGSRAAWTRDQWLARSKALDRAAKAAAAACKQYGIPAIKVASNGWPTTTKGLAAHGDFGRRGGGHTDPGPGFPWDDFTNRINRYLNTTPAPNTGGPLMALNDAEQRELLDKTRWIFDQLTGPNGGFKGWEQTGGRTTTDTVAAIAAKVGVPNTRDTKEK